MAGAKARAVQTAETDPSVDSLRVPVMSLSRLDPALLIGTKDVDELKYMSLTGRNGVKHVAVRADQVDLSDLDSELNKILSLTRETAPREVKEGGAEHVEGGVPKLLPLVSFNSSTRQPWEIDMKSLVIREKIAQGTYGTVHRGSYNTQDVAGGTHTLPAPPKTFDISFSSSLKW